MKCLFFVEVIEALTGVIIENSQPRSAHLSRAMDMPVEPSFGMPIALFNAGDKLLEQRPGYVIQKVHSVLWVDGIAVVTLTAFNAGCDFTLPREQHVDDAREQYNRVLAELDHRGWKTLGNGGYGVGEAIEAVKMVAFV